MRYSYCYADLLQGRCCVRSFRFIVCHCLRSTRQTAHLDNVNTGR